MSGQAVVISVLVVVAICIVMMKAFARADARRPSESNGREAHSILRILVARLERTTPAPTDATQPNLHSDEDHHG